MRTIKTMNLMIKLSVILGAIVLSLSASNTWADGSGVSVSGSFTLLPGGTTNYFDSANGAVPSGYGNSGTNGTVIIGAGPEFGFTNNEDLFTVDFTGTTMTLTDTCVGTGCGTTLFSVQLYSPSITGYTIDSYSFPDSVVSYGVSSIFGGNAAMFTYLGGLGFTGGTATFDYTVAAVTTAPTPESGTLGLMATGLLGVAGAIRRRLKT